MFIREITTHLYEGDVIDAKDRFGKKNEPIYQIFRLVTLAGKTDWVNIWQGQDPKLLKDKLQRLIVPVQNGIEPVRPEDIKVSKDGEFIAMPEFKIVEATVEEGTRCWKGYKKKGTKKMFGKTVPNCVKNEQVAPLSKSNSPYKQAVDMWLRSKDGRDKKAEDFKELSVVQQNKYLDKFKIKETIEASQDLNALMQGIEHDLANREKEIEENLRAWFGKGKKGGAGGGGWDRYNTKGERIGKCGDAKKGEGKPKCLSKSKAASLRSSGGKAAIGKAVSKKRRNDPNKNRKGKAKNVSNTVGKKK